MRIVGAPPLPAQEACLEFVKRYAEDSGKRPAALRAKEDSWWEGATTFFDVKRSRAWVMTRRLTHTSHHRGQQMAMLRRLGRGLHSNYGPTADTGGLMQNHAPPFTRTPTSRPCCREKLEGAQNQRCRNPALRPSPSGRTRNSAPPKAKPAATGR
jgi:hypothetical protein